ncbi:MAG: FtsQ-type POTRA domain-containing protein [Candidatus Faecousia sp.]|nr:FtsQ-type POTRA domain-containing protein [Candidatus Faecousia sp.]
MDTKQKNTGTTRKAPPRRNSQPDAGRSGARQPQSRQTPEYKRTPPQGASVYGASTGGSRSASTPARTVGKKPQKTNVLQRLLKKGAAASKKANTSREKVIRAQKQMQSQRKKKRARRYDTPAVIYTDPKPFNRSRLLVQLMSVAAVVIALVLGLSVFFKVKTIAVSGAEIYSAWAVREASGISEGDNLLTFSRARAIAKIRAELSYVDKVRIGIKLPDTVNIYIEELEVVYAIKSQDGIWWLMTSDGRMVQQSDAASAEKYTKVLGVAVESPQVNAQAIAVEAVPTETGESGETVPVTVTGAQRLSATLQILKALEANDIVGEAASVDVTSLNAIELWYGQRYQVNLGDTTNMEYKIACMNDAILQLSDYQTGKLDISFTTGGEQVIYTPFS